VDAVVAGQELPVGLAAFGGVLEVQSAVADDDVGGGGAVQR
jgi:hypothetical protein